MIDYIDKIISAQNFNQTVIIPGKGSTFQAKMLYWNWYYHTHNSLNSSPCLLWLFNDFANDTGTLKVVQIPSISEQLFSTQKLISLETWKAWSFSFSFSLLISNYHTTNLLNQFYYGLFYKTSSISHSKNPSNYSMVLVVWYSYTR